MNIILLEPVKKLGEAGEILNVKAGYARNFLIPEGLALPASKANRAELDARLEQRARALAERKGDAERLKELIGEGARVELTAKAGDERIYGSIGRQNLAAAIEETYNIQVDRRKIDLDHPIKELGSSVVNYKPHPEVAIEFTVDVVREAE